MLDSFFNLAISVLIANNSYSTWLGSFHFPFCFKILYLLAPFNMRVSGVNVPKESSLSRSNICCTYFTKVLSLHDRYPLLILISRSLELSPHSLSECTYCFTCMLNLRIMSCTLLIYSSKLMRDRQRKAVVVFVSKPHSRTITFYSKFPDDLLPIVYWSFHTANFFIPVLLMLLIKHLCRLYVSWAALLFIWMYDSSKARICSNLNSPWFVNMLTYSESGSYGLRYIDVIHTPSMSHPISLDLSISTSVNIIRLVSSTLNRSSLNFVVQHSKYFRPSIVE